MVQQDDPREYLTGVFRAALAAVRADRLSDSALAGEDFTHVIALGKAAEALAAGAWRAVEGKLEAGFLALPRGYATGELPSNAPFERHLGAHPLPDATSLAAGAALLRFTESLPRDAQVAVLVSGGASASVEVPARGIDLEFLRRANRWLLASGLPIADINRVRAGLSQLKGSGLARRLKRVWARAWMLSDVADDALEWVGGGPLSLLPAGALPALPDWLEGRLAPSPSDNSPDLSLHRLAGNAEAVAAVEEQGARIAGSLDGEAVELGKRIGRDLANGERGLFIRGGETTVRLPDNPGRGGRCQQLALAAAMEIAGRDDCFLLAASTDGWDGSEPVAGACVDGSSLARGEAEGCDPRLALAAADAGSFLEATGDRVHTGPTGTQVNDLVIALKR